MQLPKLDATTPQQVKALVAALLQNAEQQWLTALLNVTMNQGTDDAAAKAQQDKADAIAEGIAQLKADPAWASYLPTTELVE